MSFSQISLIGFDLMLYCLFHFKHILFLAGSISITTYKMQTSTEYKEFSSTFQTTQSTMKNINPSTTLGQSSIISPTATTSVLGIFVIF